jgi:hypothetical protein
MKYQDLPLIELSRVDNNNQTSEIVEFSSPPGARPVQLRIFRPATRSPNHVTKTME